ncbi:hypothetical protein FY034_18855 (plasmid) [Trichlorobacter lovleyi]|uniref:hypothetical protein n=1 Tax=Trichlorobacter lovleyi TaxID=313985 RepID=UPI00223FB684|nr:hypothetical protein [Trichlorobacter lovleyi]QOX81038.1 hypothetical protein FY034_18855 [Trichlorobacter lovleyi]
MKTVIMTVLLCVVILTSVTGYAQPAKENEYGIFGVTIKKTDKILTKKVVRAASDAAEAFGIQKRHTISVVPGDHLVSIFNPKLLTETERKEYVKNRDMVCRDQGGKYIACPSRVQPSYILVKGVFDNGCIATPTWSLPTWSDPARKHPVKPKPDGVTNMHCSKSEEEFQRILHVVVGLD